MSDQIVLACWQVAAGLWALMAACFGQTTTTRALGAVGVASTVVGLVANFA